MSKQSKKAAAAAKKPVDPRKQFKKSAGYLKSKYVSGTEIAGSKYRQKLRERQAQPA